MEAVSAKVGQYGVYCALQSVLRYLAASSPLTPCHHCLPWTTTWCSFTVHYETDSARNLLEGASPFWKAFQSFAAGMLPKALESFPEQQASQEHVLSCVS